MAGNSKSEGVKAKTFAVGGKGHMFGQQGANPQKPGESAHNAAPGVGAKFASGGSTKMFPFRPSQTAKPGCSAPE